MTDLLCGKSIAAADWPQTKSSYEATQHLNLSTTSFSKGTVNVEITFTAPTSGRVLIYIGGNARNNSYNGTTNTDYIIMSAELRETNSSGTIIQATATQGMYTCRWAGPMTAFCVRQRVSMKDGLTPGGTYWLSHQFRTANGSSSADIDRRYLIVRPLP